MIERMEPTETEIANAICALYGNGPMSETTLLEWIAEQRLNDAREYNARFGGLHTLQIDPGTIRVTMKRKRSPARTRNNAWLSCKRVGGLYHWRVGRLGGSFYIARKA